MTSRAVMRTCLGIGAALVCLLVGCGEKPGAMKAVPAYSPSPEAVWRLRRVALVELDPRDSSPEVARELSESIYTAVQSRRAFSVDFVTRSSPAGASLPAGGGPRFTLQELGEMRSALRSDAVMVGSVTGFQPYPGAWLAAQLWLIDLRSGRVLWGVDHAWRTTDSSTIKRMERYFTSECDCDDAESLRLAEMSPRMLSRFVAWEMARALPVPPADQPRRSIVRKALVVTKKTFTN